MKYAVFIVTHGRPDNVKTINSLRNNGYTGKIFFVVDDEDSSLARYKENFGNDVIVFSKKQMRGKFDLADNFPKNNTVTFARNAVWDIAVNLGYEWFVVLDDDYISYRYLWNEDRVFQSTKKYCKKLDDLFEIYFEYFSKSFMKCLSFCQEGDLIGGPNSSFGKKINAKRKVMNIYFCNTHRKFEILGRMNDDVSTYVKHGNMGDLFITTNHCCLLQTPTQQNKGGLTEMYLEMGTFVKSFYSIMFQPSSVFCKTMGKYRRIHHMVDWKYTVPKILREEYKANG